MSRNKAHNQRNKKTGSLPAEKTKAKNINKLQVYTPSDIGEEASVHNNTQINPEDSEQTIVNPATPTLPEIVDAVEEEREKANECDFSSQPIEELPTTTLEGAQPENESAEDAEPLNEEAPTTLLESVQSEEEPTEDAEPPNEEAPTTLLESVQSEEESAEDNADESVATLEQVAVEAPARVHGVESVRKHYTQDQELPRRARVNRLLIRKRRHKRLDYDPAPRITLVLAVVLALLTTLFSGSAGAAYAFYQTQMPLLDSMAQHSLFQTTHIYDRNGKLLYELYDKQEGRGRRTYANYADISPLLIQATVAAEDRTFWDNTGVDPYGIGRALVSDVHNGGAVEGASTITQQLIKKQLYDDQPRTLQIKGEEAILATGLTQKYPKWKIMEMYLNTIFYGDLNYGAEAAAEGFFRLQPACDNSGHCSPALKNLTLGQASMLAGLPQSPTVYNPLMNKQAALDRQAIVLQAMVDMKYITPQQKDDAQKEMTNFKFEDYTVTHPIQAPHFVWYVIQNVLEPLLGAENLATGGYNIYTTLDLDLEKKVEQITHDDLYTPQYDREQGFYGILSSAKNVNNAAVTVMDPKTGEILAMNGSADYNESRPTMNGQDNAALALRQPGSSFKPIVYATAFEMGWYPAMIVPDHKTVYPAVPVPYEPNNYDGRFHTSVPMTIRTAVGNSFNIPAIDALMYAGVPNVLNMAGRLGLSEVQNRTDIGASLALGSGEVSLLHLTSAYATFANNGVRAPISSVLKITDNQGNSLYQLDRSHPAGQQVVRPDVAFLVNSILSDKSARYLEFSHGNVLELGDRPVAAKTGTTDQFRDNWTMGYTPNLAVGVWAGNSNNAIMYNVIGITGAGPIWHDVMTYATQHYNLPPDDFAKPDDVHRGTVSAVSGLAARPGEATVSDWFIDGTLPTIQGSNIYSPPNTCDPNADPNNTNGNNAKKCDSKKNPGNILPGNNFPWNIFP